MLFDTKIKGVAPNTQLPTPTLQFLLSILLLTALKIKKDMHITWTYVHMQNLRVAKQTIYMQQNSYILITSGSTVSFESANDEGL